MMLIGRDGQVTKLCASRGTLDRHIQSEGEVVESLLKRIALVCSLLLAASSQAAAPAGAPADSTGLCKDGTYYNGATKKGACSGHQGVKDWWGATTTAPAPAAAAPASKAAPAAAEAAQPAPAAKAATTHPTGAMAAGAGPGQVWVNTDSKVYHCSGDEWYGKTKQGQYMKEGDAVAKGFRPARGKSCK